MARLVHQGLELHATGVLRIRLDDPDWYRRFGERVAGGKLEAGRNAVPDCGFLGSRTACRKGVAGPGGIGKRAKTARNFRATFALSINCCPGLTGCSRQTSARFSIL